MQRAQTFNGHSPEEESCPFAPSCGRASVATPNPQRLFRESVGKHYTPSPNILREQLGDRFIPCRAGTNLFAKFMAADAAEKKSRAVPLQSSQPQSQSGSSNSNGDSSSSSGEVAGTLLTKEEQQLNSYSKLLQSQLLDENESENVCWDPTACGGAETAASRALKSGKRNLLRFKQDVRKSDPNCVGTSVLGLDGKFGAGQELDTPPRVISKVPFKILDAPQLQDDFYLNLVDWSSQNLLSVGLGASVYVWSACTSKVTKLLDVEGDQDSITSVAWSQRGSHLAIGLNSGVTQIWDIHQQKQVRSVGGHTGRISSISWNNSIVSTGSRDRTILQHDVRAAEESFATLAGHKQEVCGLKWSFDGQQLASGGNDNKLFLWSLQSSAPLARFSDHQAAVKAIAWSPHQHGLLASGGGTADRCIKFWNTLTCECASSLDTGSQVCNLMFSRNANELVSTHGYSLNQMIVWKYPQMSKLATLTGHTYRVLYLSMSPDGESIVTGAGDETLRFWNVFPPLKSKAVNVFGCSSGLVPASMDIR